MLKTQMADRVVILILLTVILAVAAGVTEVYARGEGEVRLVYDRFLPYGLFADITDQDLRRCNFDPDKHACVLVKITVTARKNISGSACWNVTNISDDPCRPGNKIILVVGKEHVHKIKNASYVDLRLIFLFRSPVYGQGIPQGIYDFLTVYEGK